MLNLGSTVKRDNSENIDRSNDGGGGGGVVIDLEESKIISN